MVVAPRNAPDPKSPPGGFPPPWPALKTEIWPIDRIKPYAKNARTHSIEDIRAARAAIDQYGWTYPLLVDEKDELIAGHRRLGASMLEPAFEEVPVMVARGWTPEQIKAYRIWDNKSTLSGGWDEGLLRAELGELQSVNFDLSFTGFQMSELNVFSGGGAPPGLEETTSAPKAAGALSDKFWAVPFSVLNAREGWWQDRKRAWLALGIESEVGRGGNLLKKSLHDRVALLIGGGNVGKTYQAGKDFIDKLRLEGKADDEILATAQKLNDERAAKRKNKPGLAFSKTIRHGEEPDEISAAIAETGGAGTSIFDPVLCELAYRWFCPPKGQILDPFAGGSVRGIVASKLGRQYTGIDLRPEQVEANRAQAKGICKGKGNPKPVWIEGDSAGVVKLAKGTKADFIFSCPPYGDLERYSDDARDLSTMDYAAFLASYRQIIEASCKLLAKDRFACFVVGDIRDPDDRGVYRGFHCDTIKAFQDAGLHLYNHAILITSAGTLPIRVGRGFESARKLGTTHQNVLVFIKGDPRKATEAIGAVEFGEPEEMTATPGPSTYGEKVTAKDIGGEV